MSTEITSEYLDACTAKDKVLALMQEMLDQHSHRSVVIAFMHATMLLRAMVLEVSDGKADVLRGMRVIADEYSPEPKQH